MNLLCPNCGQAQDVPEPKPGEGVQCPTCLKVFIPLPHPVPPPITPAPPPLFLAPPSPAASPDKDQEHLRLLRIFYFVCGGITGFFSCIPLIHVALGIGFLVAPHSFGGRGDAPPAFVGWLFIVLGSTFILSGWTLATLMLLCGKFLGQRRRYTFCFVTACISCLFMPHGTVLGVFTIIVLSRDSVKRLFGQTTR